MSWKILHQIKSLEGISAGFRGDQRYAPPNFCEAFSCFVCSEIHQKCGPILAAFLLLWNTCVFMVKISVFTVLFTTHAWLYFLIRGSDLSSNLCFRPILQCLYVKMRTRLLCAFCFYCLDGAFRLNPYLSNSGFLYALLMPVHSNLAWTVVLKAIRILLYMP